MCIFDCFTAIVWKTLNQSGLPMFIQIGHESYQDWYDNLDEKGDNARIDVKYVQNLLNNFNGKISGIILKWITGDVSVSFKFMIK